MRLKWFLLLTGLGLILGPTVALSQFGGRPGGFGGRGNGGGFATTDPNERWTQMTGGRPVWRRSEITDPNLQRRFDFMAQMLGIGTGEITREQYLSLSARRSAPGGAAVGAAASGQPGASNLQPGGRPGPGGGLSPDAIAEWRFRQMDLNGDGLLNYDEMDDTLRAERDRWDTNKDGFIDLDEFKEYTQARIQQYQGNGQGGPPVGGGPMAILEEGTEKRPSVYRPGKLPANLPAWFLQYDTDGDGQIGLYEWKAAGQPVAQFEAMDRNGDGFLTPEEVLRTVPAPARSGAPNAPGGTASPGRGGTVAMGPGAFPGGGGGNRGTGGPGGRGNRGPGGGRDARGGRGPGGSPGGGPGARGNIQGGAGRGFPGGPPVAGQ
jgi:hypothetical protein